MVFVARAIRLTGAGISIALKTRGALQAAGKEESFVRWRAHDCAAIVPLSRLELPSVESTETPWDVRTDQMVFYISVV